MRLSIFAAAREAPNRIALITDAGRFTYSDLAALTAGRAAALVDSRTSRTSRTSRNAQDAQDARECRQPLLLQPRLDLDSLLWLYAAFATGTPFLPLHTQATAPERAAVEARTGARPPPSPYSAAGSGSVERDVDPASPFCLMLTSGSTGAPKIVVLSRHAVLASAAASDRNLGVDTEERWLLCLSLSHVAGVAIVVRMLAARRTVVLFAPGPAGLLSRIADVGRLLHQERVTLVSLVPPLLERLLRAGFQPPHTLRAVLLGGAGCSPDLAERARQAGVPLLTSYGLTETGSQVAARRFAERHAPLPRLQGCVSSGHALSGVEIKIVGGRIAVKSAALLSGYVGMAGPAVDAGWFVTSDRGALGPQGELYVLGRSDSVIVTGGENVDPEEVERVLRLLPEVHDACVFGVPCAEFGQRIVAVIVPAAAAPRLQLDTLTLQLRPQLARFKLPRALVITADLPFTASGKLDRRTCADRFGPLC